MLSEFQSERQAKEYLIAQIVTEAQLESVPLSEIERKMLYFSETGWTLPNILEVNAEFERDYDNDEYEQKIAGLVREIERRNDVGDREKQSSWDDAVVKLSEGDHYLLVLIGLGRESSIRRPLAKWLPSANVYGTGELRQPGDFYRLMIAAFVLLLVIFGVAVLATWLKEKLGG